MKGAFVLSTVFIVVLGVDIYFNNTPQLSNFRLITKPTLTLLLFILFYKNRQLKTVKEQFMLTVAFILMAIGDIFLLENLPCYSLPVGLVTFLGVNLIYAWLFYQTAHFSLKKSLPYILFVFLYCFVVFYMIYDKLGAFFAPTMVYMLILLNMAQAAYLRYSLVNKSSYYLILFGAILFLVSQSIVALNNFYKEVPYKNILIMLFYGVSQLLIILGLLAEKRNSENMYKTTYR